MNDLSTFIWAVVTQWVASMSGVVSLALGIILRARGNDVSNKIFLSIAGFCLLASCFLAWRDERVSVRETKNELAKVKEESEQELKEARDLNSPKLSGEIEQVVIGRGADENEPQILIRLSVRNLGSRDAQSIAEGFKLHIKAKDFEASEDPVEIPKDYTLIPVDGSPEVPISKQDAITEKTAKPIQGGTLERGWLMFVVQGVESDVIGRPGMKYTVSFSDVSGKTSKAEHILFSDKK